MSRKQDTRSQKPGASRTWQYVLSELQLGSLEECEKLKRDLECDGAKNLKVYAGAWQVEGSLGNTIHRKEGGEALYGPAALNDLLAWLKSANTQGPLVIEADLPPFAQSETQEPSDYQKEIKRVLALPNDTVGILIFDRAWSSVKKLAEIERNLPYTDRPIELEAQRKELRKILLESYPDAAEKLGLPKPPTTVELTDRERNILNVICQGAEGLQYCRELHNAGIRPRRSGSWKDCPGTYPAAYQSGSPWRHRIQDEKSKISRKAKLAATRPSLTGE